RIAKEVTAAVGVVFAGVLKVNGERCRARKDEAADVGGLLVALGLRQATRLEEVPREKARRIRQAAAAAIFQVTVDAERPAGVRLDRNLRAEHARIAAARHTVIEDVVAGQAVAAVAVDLRQPCEREFILDPEA